MYRSVCVEWLTPEPEQSHQQKEARPKTQVLDRKRMCSGVSRLEGKMYVQNRMAAVNLSSSLVLGKFVIGCERELPREALP